MRSIKELISTIIVQLQEAGNHRGISVVDVILCPYGWTIGDSVGYFPSTSVITVFGMTMKSAGDSRRDELWTLRLRDTLPTLWSFRLLDTSPTIWTFCLQGPIKLGELLVSRVLFEVRRVKSVCLMSTQCTVCTLHGIVIDILLYYGTRSILAKT